MSAKTPDPKAARRAAQLTYYSDGIDAEYEITRPRPDPRPVRALITTKVRDALALLGEPLAGRQALVVCCGSGMDAELLERAGLRVVGLDLSLAALQRARERGRRFGLAFGLVGGDAARLPFPDNAFDLVFVHDGLHHLPDAYAGVREMLRVAAHAVVIAEPANAPLTRLAVRMGLASEYEEAGNYVYRLSPARLVETFRAGGATRWRFRQDLVYYQPWTYRFYRRLEGGIGFRLFRGGFRLANRLLGRWGNSLKAVAWKA